MWLKYENLTSNTRPKEVEFKRNWKKAVEYFQCHLECMRQCIASFECTTLKVIVRPHANWNKICKASKVHFRYIASLLNSPQISSIWCYSFFRLELAIIESTLQTENYFFKKATAKYAQLINVWKGIIQILPGGWRVAAFIHALLAWFIILIDIKARPLTDWIVCHSKMHSIPYIKSVTFV